MLLCMLAMMEFVQCLEEIVVQSGHQEALVNRA